MSLEELNRFMQEKHMQGYWTRGEVRSYEPTSEVSPYVWKWADIEEVLEGAGKYVDIKHAFRRNIGLENPTGQSKTINMGLQLVLPGEKARAHRHTAEAIRFIIQGNPKVWSTVDGEATTMESGDLVLTPNWSWHDHVNDSSEPAIWIDGLNAAIMGHLGLAFREDFPTPNQPVESLPEYSKHRASLTRPNWLELSTSLAGAPYRYKWSDTQETLNALKVSEGDPCDGVILHYTSPWTGGSTLPMISCAIQLLRPGLKTKAHRHTSIGQYHVVQGSGVTRVGDVELQWGRRDFFVVPPWSWHSHENLGSEDAILFSMSDAPLLKPFGFYREEIEGEEVRRDRNHWFGPF